MRLYPAETLAGFYAYDAAGIAPACATPKPNTVSRLIGHQVWIRGYADTVEVTTNLLDADKKHYRRATIAMPGRRGPEDAEPKAVQIEGGLLLAAQDEAFITVSAAPSGLVEANSHYPNCRQAYTFPWAEILSIYIESSPFVPASL